MSPGSEIEIKLVLRQKSTRTIHTIHTHTHNNNNSNAYRGKNETNSIHSLITRSIATAESTSRSRFIIFAGGLV
jgi:hypothetical protein